MTRLRILQELIALVLRATMIPLIVREVVQRRKVTIILYHVIPASLFEKHLKYLSRKYSIISLGEFLEAKRTKDMSKLPIKPIVITFDDGRDTTYRLKPLIQKYNIPITFFVFSDIIGTNRHYWWHYGDRLKSDLRKVKDAERLRLLKGVGFDERKNYDYAEALSEAEIADLIGIGVSFQSHTLTHPILPMCDDLKAEREIVKSKANLEEKFGIKVDYLSYPDGDYCARDIEICKKAGYLAGITTDLGFNDVDTDVYRLKRIGIYDNASVNQLAVRATGVWHFVKHLFEKNKLLREKL